MGRVEGEFTLILHSFYLNLFLKKELTFLYIHMCVCVCVCVCVCIVFLKERASSHNSPALKGFKPTSSGLVPLPHFEADTCLGLPSFSSTRLDPLPRALALAATSSQDCLPGRLLPLRLRGGPCLLQSMASAHRAVVLSKPASPSGGGSSPSGQVLPLCSESLVP